MREAIKTRFTELSIEEVANTITHGFGLLLAIAGFVALVVLAGLRGDPLLIAACVVYGVSLVVLYTASTVYHVTLSPELKHKLRVVDHCCIYLLIAGSYTPFGLVISNASRGEGLLAGIWAFALVGIIAKLILQDRYSAISVVSYVVMGWLGALAVQPLFEILGLAPVLLAIAGGLSYSIGVVFFGWHRIPHNHAIFHVFVLVGSILHYAAVVLYVVPYTTNL